MIAHRCDRVNPVLASPSDVATLSKPALFYVLAAFGLVLGGFGPYYALGKGVLFLQNRDRFVSAVRAAAEVQSAAIPPEGRDAAMTLVEKQADVVYSRRGVTIPLAGMNVILSLLLFLGCARAMRGDPWGLSAWALAAMVSIPYVVIDSALSLVQSRELAELFRDAPDKMIVLQFQKLGTLVAGGAQLVYFAVCVGYLRRTAIRRLFLDRGPPAA